MGQQDERFVEQVARAMELGAILEDLGLSGKAATLEGSLDRFAPSSRRNSSQRKGRRAQRLGRWPSGLRNVTDGEDAARICMARRYA